MEEKPNNSNLAKLGTNYSNLAPREIDKILPIVFAATQKTLSVSNPDKEFDNSIFPLLLV